MSSERTERPASRARRQAASGSGTATPKLVRRGTHRSEALTRTLDKIRPLMPPLGITRVANVTGLDCIGIPVVMVCRPNARSLAVSQGKGLDLDAARVSGLMETIELYHAERILKPLVLASWNELRHGARVAPVEALPRISISPFHADLQLLWIQGTNAVSGEPTFLPFETVHTNYTLPLPTGSGSFVLSSNGLASGNHLLEAVSHGMCEVIERDATTLFRCMHAGDRAARRVDPSSVADADCRHLLDLFERAGVAVAIWDVTTDVGVATFHCIALDQSLNPFRRLGPLEGSGCHPVREIALQRALTEAAQARLTLIAGSRDDYGHERHQRTHETEILERASKLLAEAGTRRFDDCPSFENDTFEADIAQILSQLAESGVEAPIVVDLSRPEFELAVVRVVIPGLETYHHVPGWQPGPRAQRVLEAKARKERQWQE